MKNLIARFVKDESGATAIEYGLIAAGISVAIIAVVAAGVAVLIWMILKPSGPGVGFASGNGRIEATEIDVAAKLGGRVQEVTVNEGDFVQTGQILAQGHDRHQAQDSDQNEDRLDRARDDVGIAAGGERDDQAHRMIGKLPLRPCLAGEQCSEHNTALD